MSQVDTWRCLGSVLGMDMLVTVERALDKESKDLVQELVLDSHNG